MASGGMKAPRRKQQSSYMESLHRGAAHYCEALLSRSEISYDSASQRRAAGSGSEAESLLSPDLLQVGPPAGEKIVTVVADRGFFVVVLMVFFGRVKCRVGDDVCRDGLVKFFRVFQLLFRCFRQIFLLFVVIENSRCVLSSLVRELPAVIGRIDLAPEDVQELVIGNPGRVKRNLHGLPVAGAARGNFLIRRVFLLPSGKTGNDRMNAVVLFIGFLHAPETAARKRCQLHFFMNSTFAHHSFLR